MMTFVSCSVVTSYRTGSKAKMHRKQKAVKAFLAALVIALLAAGDGAAEAPPTFEALLEEGGLDFTAPPEMEAVTPARTPFFAFEKGFRHRELKLEIHYAIRPIARMETTHVDAHGAVPEPNYLYTMIFKSLASRMAEGTRTQRRDYEAAQAEAVFGAEWAAASQFETADGVLDGYDYGLLLAIHKADHADAFTLFLFDDLKAVRAFVNANVNALRFRMEDAQ